MKVIVTLVHGTWAGSASWTHADSTFRASLRRALTELGAEVDIRTHVWSGANSIRARAAAAQTLAIRLQDDLRAEPNGSHFVVAHSHGGNIAIEAARHAGIEEQLAGIVTMSTPFLSCRRSGARPAVVVLGTFVLSNVALLLFSLLFTAGRWTYKRLELHVSGIMIWPARLLAVCIGMYLFFLFGKLPGALINCGALLWERITDKQDAVLARYDQSLRYPVPTLCVRFRLDEAWIALYTSRLVAKPARFLTVVTSSVGLTGAVLLLGSGPVLLPVGFVIVIWDVVFGTSFAQTVAPVFLAIPRVGALLFVLSVVPTLVCLAVWAIGGYVIQSMTWGHGGGLLAQVLADFRVSTVPQGVAATAKVYSPWVLKRMLRHSLAYTDPAAISDIASWMAVQVHDRERTCARTTMTAERRAARPPVVPTETENSSPGPAPIAPATNIQITGRTTPPVRVGGEVKPPSRTKYVKPVYPEIARSALVHGVVMLEILVAEDGSVKHAKVLRSSRPPFGSAMDTARQWQYTVPLLEEAAVDAVTQWTFAPTHVNGEPRAVLMVASVPFDLAENKLRLI